jgi:hypothetical protein
MQLSNGQIGCDGGSEGSKNLVLLAAGSCYEGKGRGGTEHRAG